MSGPLIPVDTEDGWTLYMEEHPPAAVAGLGGAAAARGAVLVSHGMMVNRKIMDRPPGRGLVSHLRRRGYHVYSLDLRGHGASGPKAAAGATWSYDDLVQRDLPAALRAVARRHPELPRALVGHSLSAHGGGAALGLAPELPVDAAVLISPVVWIRGHEPAAGWWAVKRLLLAAWYGLTRTVGHMPARRLGIGTEDEPPAYVRQFVDWARSGRWTSRDGSVDYLEALARVEVPVLVLTARGDRWICRPPAVERFAAALRRAPVELRVLGRRDLPELPRQPGHMTLVTDPRSRPAWDLLADWLDRTLPAVSPRGA
jgi:predicted alpha/beta hydrolase